MLRTALPGIVSGAILAIARVVGETAPLLMTAGYIVNTNFNLFGGQMTTLPVYVYQEYSKLNANCPATADASCVTTIPMERSWAAALALIPHRPDPEPDRTHRGEGLRRQDGTVSRNKLPYSE